MDDDVAHLAILAARPGLERLDRAAVADGLPQRGQLDDEAVAVGLVGIGATGPPRHSECRPAVAEGALELPVDVERAHGIAQRTADDGRRDMVEDSQQIRLVSWR